MPLTVPLTARLTAWLTAWSTAVHGQLLPDSWHLPVAGTLSAFLGSYPGHRMIETVTMEGSRRLEGVMLLFLLPGVAVCTGVVGSR